MLVNLESLITDSIANETVSVIDMESVDMELTDILMECGELKNDICTCDLALTVMDSVNETGNEDKSTGIFKKFIEKIKIFFKHVVKFFHMIIEKILTFLKIKRPKKDIKDNVVKCLTDAAESVLHGDKSFSFDPEKYGFSGEEWKDTEFVVAAESDNSLGYVNIDQLQVKNVIAAYGLKPEDMNAALQTIIAFTTKYFIQFKKIVVTDIVWFDPSNLDASQFSLKAAMNWINDQIDNYKQVILPKVIKAVTGNDAEDFGDSLQIDIDEFAKLISNGGKKESEYDVVKRIIESYAKNDKCIHDINEHLIGDCKKFETSMKVAENSIQSTLNLMNSKIQNSLVLHKIRVYLSKLSTVISHVLNAVSKYLSFMSGVNALYSRLDVIFANAA